MTENGDDSPPVGEFSQSNWEPTATSTHRTFEASIATLAAAPGGWA